MQRVYHFVPLLYGLQNLRYRRLKIARLNELNDPFELFGIAQPDRNLRHAARRTKDALAQTRGLLCFSLDWHNPLLWSHYADKHRGIALGFDVDEQILMSVIYRRDRPVLKAIDAEVADWLLFTKYKGWSYECETRIYTTLEDQDPETNLYFADFSDQLKLREVIAGTLGTATRQELLDAIVSERDVELIRARLAFRSFKVVADRRGLADVSLAQ